MARKPKIEPIESRNFQVIIVIETSENNDVTQWNVERSKSWFVRDRNTLANTEPSFNLEDYYKLKRVWRRSKENFESACRFMDYGTLFSRGGIPLP